MNAKVLESSLLNEVREGLEAIVPMKAAFDKNYAKNLDGTYMLKPVPAMSLPSK
jgi:myo-inositol-1-phosphate synthase